MMKKSLISAAVALMCCVCAWAQIPLSISDVKFDRDGDRMKSSFKVDLTAIESVKGAVSFVPVICKDSIRFSMTPIGLYSRNRFYAAAREARSDDPFLGVPFTYYIKDVPDTLYYADSAPYMDWMNGASLRIDTLYTGCCDRFYGRREGVPFAVWNEPSAEESPVEEVVAEEPPVDQQAQVEEQPEDQQPQAEDQPQEPVIEEQPVEPETPPEEHHVAEEYQSEDVQVKDNEDSEDVQVSSDVNDVQVSHVYVPYFIYVQPSAETIVKERAISGEAYVMFRSGAAEVDDTFKDNASELQKIRATVDSVRVDPDITITSVILRGYSSPDGGFSLNQTLSEQRVEAIRKYVVNLFELPEEVWHTEAAGENWEGLRKAVEEASNLPNKSAILTLIDSNYDPDTKEYLISRYYWDYQVLYNEIYPTLRRTDYKVMYTVRSYTTVEEVREIMETKPWNLSLNEFFLVAEGLEPGTAEFNRVFRLAARVFPDDPTAQINAASAAMAIGDLESAAKHLEKAGDSPEARYTKGVLAAMKEDYETAARYFSSADLSGFEPAAQALESVNKILNQGK